MAYSYLNMLTENKSESKIILWRRYFTNVLVFSVKQEWVGIITELSKLLCKAIQIIKNFSGRI